MEGISTLSSSFACCSANSMARKVPVRPTPALSGGRGGGGRGGEGRGGEGRAGGGGGGAIQRGEDGGTCSLNHLVIIATSLCVFDMGTLPLIALITATVEQAQICLAFCTAFPIGCI